MHINKTSASERATIFFMLLCSAVYFTSYITRTNYGAVLVDMIADTGISQKAAGLVSTSAFFTYGIGQLISGFIGDRVKPRLLIVIGMSVTAVCNLLMPFLTSAVPMMILWGINGFAQAMFWPPMVRMMADNLSEDNYNRACIWVSVGSSVATIVIYLLASLCTAVWNWRSLFFISAVAAVAMAVVWQLFAPKKDIMEKPVEVVSSERKPTGRLRIGAAVVIMMVPIAIAIVLQGILRDGVTTWLPTLVSDTFDLSSSVSILTGIALPIFSMISYNVSAALEKKIGNELITSAVFFGIAAVSAGLLTLLLDVNPFISVLLLAVITGCMHGINLMLISRVPRYFDRYGKISTISGVVNAFTYVGSALSTYLFAAMSEDYGWGFTVASWLAIAAVGTAICVLTIGSWNKFRKQR
ncbi:MAG: MFS transporter [Clostridia bacterium]|nr:MFS transporter [Clostridia bacterium]